MCEDLSYLAALIDGEGCISLKPNSRKPQHQYARVRIGMRDPEAVLWAYDTFGGNYHLDKKGTHFWTMNGVQGVELLEKVRPYLKLQRRVEAADKAINGNAPRARNRDV